MFHVNNEEDKDPWSPTAIYKEEIGTEGKGQKKHCSFWNMQYKRQLNKSTDPPLDLGMEAKMWAEPWSEKLVNGFWKENLRRFQSASNPLNGLGRMNIFLRIIEEQEKEIAL